MKRFFSMLITCLIPFGLADASTEAARTERENQLYEAGFCYGLHCTRYEQQKTLEYTRPQLPLASTLPITPEEQALWQKGWDEGIKVAIGENKSFKR